MTPNLKFALENRQKVAVSLLVVNSHESGAGCESSSSGMLGEVPAQRRNCRLLSGCA